MKPDRVTLLLAGQSGAGKSYFVASLPKALIIDSDIGGGLHYADTKIRANGSRRIGPGGLNEDTEDETSLAEYPDLLKFLIEEDRKGRLANITTLAIDHLTVFQDNAVSRINPKLERDYGRANDIGTREWKKIREFCRYKDFNLVCVAHLKGKFEADQQVGQQAAGPKEIAGDMDIELHVKRGPKYPSTALVMKWRRLPDDPRGQVPAFFPFTFKDFAAIEGTNAFDRARDPIVITTPQQVQTLRELLEVVKLPEGTEAKWLKKAGVDSFEEMPQADVVKCIAHIQKLLKSTHNGKEQTNDALQPAGRA